MRLTKQSSYAVRALMYCALNEPHLSQVSAISDAYGISEAFLFKLIKPLVKNGLLATVRGRNGGIRLARPANEITVYESVRLTEGQLCPRAVLRGVERRLPADRGVQVPRRTDLGIAGVL